MPGFFFKYHRRFFFILHCGMLVLLLGCDPATRHQTLSTLFDGVPELPPAEQLCQDYVDELQTSSLTNSFGEEGGTNPKGGKTSSIHSPYEEKNCGGCHKTGAGNELLVPPTELCMVCHVDFIQGNHVHGPIAVGDCLACHLPHQSKNPSLLVKSREEICSKCHKEQRLAAGLHNNVEIRGLICVDCHGAHFGKNRFFLN